MKSKFKTLSIVLLSLTLFGCNNPINSDQSNSTSIDENLSSNSALSNSISLPESISSIEETSSSNIEDVHVNSLAISNKDITTLKCGQTLQLNVSILPENATNKIVNYSSSDESVASVSFNGLVQARKEGTCTITATSDDGGKSDSITITVVASTVTNFTISFVDDIETIISNNNTFYKLVLKQQYKLDVQFDSTDKNDEILEANFNLDGYCSFDTNTNTLIPLKKVDSLILTLKVKGTNLKKEFYLRIITTGEKDASEVINKLNTSAEKENNKNIQSYNINLDFDTLDVYETRTHATQSTTFKVYKAELDRYMMGDVDTSIITTKKGASSSTTSQTRTHIYKGLSKDGNYYEYQVDDDGYHYVTPLKKAVVSEVSDSKTQITRENALKQSTKIIMNSHVGLSEIAKMHFTGLYENSIGFGSAPIYFGQGADVNLSIVENNNVVTADTYFVEQVPSKLFNGEVYFNHGEYTFNDEGLLTSIKVLSYVYDKTSFDFDNNVLAKDAKYVEMYKTEYTQTFGSLYTLEENELDPSNLYFTSYNPVLATASGYRAEKYEIGKSYYISFENQVPKYADSRIDSIIIDDSSDTNVAIITNDGRGISIVGSGITTLTIYSTKNRVKTELIVNVDVTLPESIKVLVDGKETSLVEANVGDTIDNISFSILPDVSSQEVDVKLDGVGALTPKANGTYSFTSTQEGTATITFTSKVDKNVTASIEIKINKKQEATTFIDKVLSNTYSCDVVNGTDIQSNTLKFVSSTKAVFEIDSNDYGKVITIECDVIIDETNKKVTFTSFEIVSGNVDFDEYALYEPVIKQNISYQINDDATEITVQLICIEYGEEIDFNGDGEYVFASVN